MTKIEDYMDSISGKIETQKKIILGAIILETEDAHLDYSKIVRDGIDLYLKRYIKRNPEFKVKYKKLFKTIKI